ncbi:MAG: hypothetical protein LBD75_06935 [Candidatus Peribacteria bacterium]|jgi:hypothetical protein|nr:hypothetical protein [Candidatus Peribacteria bacterium]
MFQKIRHQLAQMTQQWHDQFAAFKAKVKGYRNKKFPHLPRKGASLPLPLTPPVEQGVFSTHRIVIFWAVGLLFVALGYLAYHTLSYLYMLIAAGILSVALEGVITFWSRLTRSRGVGIAIAYLLLFFFLLSGFAIIVPFLVNR